MTEAPEMTWLIAGDRWTMAEVKRASAMARERASIDSLAGMDSQVQLTWLTWARGLLAHEALQADPGSVPAAMPPRRAPEKETKPAPIEGRRTGPRLAIKDEIPTSCGTMWRNALQNGWWCYIEYYRGPWVELKDAGRKIVIALQVASNLDVEPVEIYGMAEVVILRGKKAGEKFQASWVKKPWTKNATFKFEAGHYWPDGNGLVPSPELTKRIKGIWPVDPVITEEEYS